MAFKVNYRAAQGQQGAQTPGGGYLLDQVRFNFASQTSNALIASQAIWVVPQIDTADFVVSVLGDYTQSSAGTPTFRLGRATIAFAASYASVASTSAPVLTIVRNRIEGGNASGSVSQAVIARWDLSAFTVSLQWANYHVSGSLISNGTLQAGDVLTLATSAASTTMSVPAGVLLLDIEA